MNDHTNISNNQPAESWLPWLYRAGPMVLVFAVLAGVAYVGNRNEWTVPKFAELFGGSKSDKDDWCAEHSVPESICVECKDSLLPKLKTAWCEKHGVHNCPFEHPEIAQTNTTAVVGPEDLDRAERAFQLKDRPENNPKCPSHERRIQFASEEAFEKVAVEVKKVERGPIYETISTSGEIVFDQPRVAPASSPVAGRVWLITEQGQIGAEVKRGDLLALLDAVEVGKAKAELLQAHAQVDSRKRTLTRINDLMVQGGIPPSRVSEAEAALREARIRLMAAQQALNNMGLPIRVDDNKAVATEELAARIQFFGIPPEIASKLDAKTTTANLMPVVASRDGIVTAARVTLGEMADAGKPLFVVADTSHMWLMLNVRLEDVRYLHVRDPKTGFPGQTVKFRADGSSKEVEGKLVWRSTEVDEKTRTVHYRAEVPNPDGTLLANTYGTGQVVIRAEIRAKPGDPAEKEAIVVPNEAIHWDGDCHIVFVRDKHFLEPAGLKVFHVRTVRPGVTNGPNTEILAGVLPGEFVATRNSAILRAELLKANLGGGE